MIKRNGQRIAAITMAVALMGQNVTPIFSLENLTETAKVEDEAKNEAEKIKLAITDKTINKLAKYVHKELGLTNLDCDYDINKEKCRCCARRTNKIIN